ncbi:MAG: hypothetical protein IPJ65_20540 [Archangiaceae bacterium]|nr:hypothetical protein [Archangiaceae bacterium]
MSRLPVFDVVAEDWWEYTHEEQVYVAHVAIGRPRRGDDGWTCPLRIEGAHEVWNPFSMHKRWKGWKAIPGQGPFDAMMNALMFAFRLFGELTPRSVAAPIRALEKAAKRKPYRARKRRAKR